MAAERNVGARPPANTDDSRHETVTTEIVPPEGADATTGLVEAHRQTAQRMLAEGAPAKAFGELVRAARAVPMTPRLAAYLINVSRKAGAEAAAVTLLQSGVD